MKFILFLFLVCRLLNAQTTQNAEAAKVSKIKNQNQNQAVNSKKLSALKKMETAKKLEELKKRTRSAKVTPVTPSSAQDQASQIRQKIAAQVDPMKNRVLDPKERHAAPGGANAKFVPTTPAPTVNTPKVPGQ